MTEPMNTWEINERKRFDTIVRAVKAAESIIMRETDGSVETLLWLTIEMASVYQDKAQMMITAQLHQKELTAAINNHQ